MKHVLRFYPGGVIVSAHAMDSFHEATRLMWTPEAIKEAVEQSKHVSIDEVRLNGYSPFFERRLEKGIHSWYAIHKQFGWDVVFVLAEGKKIDSDELIVTTVLFNKAVQYRR